jgi:hypothetical protein
VSFTYEDHVLASGAGEVNQRNVGVSVLGRRVGVPPAHPRNHDGESFSVLVTKTVDRPLPGSDDINRAFEDCWVGTSGYHHAGGKQRAIAFQGQVVTARGETISEVFVVDLPDDLTVPGDGPLEGTATTRPRPPKGTVQRRLTYTADRRYPGIQGPRHWLRSSPDGSCIPFLMRDDRGIVQIFAVSPTGGDWTQMTTNDSDIASAFTWGPDSRLIAHVLDGSVCVTEGLTGRPHRMMPPLEPPPRPEACVFSPDGTRIAYVRPVAHPRGVFTQVFVCDVVK